MIYATDTHPLIYWASDRKVKLGKQARRIFQEVERGRHSIVVPVVVLEELARLVEKNVLRPSVPFRRWAEEIDRSPNFQVQSYTIEIVLESTTLGSIRDPADRAIVATAGISAVLSLRPMRFFRKVSGSTRCGNSAAAVGEIQSRNLNFRRPG